MSATNSGMAALAAYRSVLRATRIAFRGDHRVFLAAREQARDSFAQDSTLAAGSAEAEARIIHAREVAQFLRQNVVQGERTIAQGDGGEEVNVAAKVDGHRYKLNVHAETERGDNDTIRAKPDKMTTEEAGSLAGVKSRPFR